MFTDDIKHYFLGEFTVFTHVHEYFLPSEAHHKLDSVGIIERVREYTKGLFAVFTFFTFRFGGLVTVRLA